MRTLPIRHVQIGNSEENNQALGSLRYKFFFLRFGRFGL